MSDGMYELPVVRVDELIRERDEWREREQALRREYDTISQDALITVSERDAAEARVEALVRERDGLAEGWYEANEREKALEARVAALTEALEAAQGEAYLGMLAGDDTPSPLDACQNVINACLGILGVREDGSQP